MDKDEEYFMDWSDHNKERLQKEFAEKFENTFFTFCQEKFRKRDKL